MDILIVTGASSGIGKKFAEKLTEEYSFDEVWAVARRADRLEALKSELKIPVKSIPIDLSDEKSYIQFEQLLKTEKPTIKMLVNAAGFGLFKPFYELDRSRQTNMIDLNVKALTAMCHICIPYMKSGSKIINIASMAAFQPVPFIGVYSATKSFVLSFSRSLNFELYEKGIKCLAVCPYWTKTEFFDRAVSDDTVKYYAVMYEPEQIVNKALKDLKSKNKDVSIFGFKANGQAMLTKIVPHGLVMKIWAKQQGKNR